MFHPPIAPSATALAIACALACLPSAVLAQAQAQADSEAQTLAQAGGSHVIVISGAKLAAPAAVPATLESVSAIQIEESINTATTAGVLQYLPSVHVRERYIGDRNAVLVMRVNSSIASAQTTVYADGLLLSNFLANSFSTAPRWGLVSPEEIDRVDVMYGPFSALYPGNSAGGVVRLITRTPKRFEAHVKVDAFTQRFKHYGTDDSFSGGHASASLGDAVGNFTYWLALDHLDSRSQPQTFGSTAAATGSGAPIDVSGSPVHRDIDTSGRARIIVSSTGIDHTVQDMAKLKLGWRLSPSVKASYNLGIWQNQSDTRVDSYLRDASGRSVYSGRVLLDGTTYSIANTAPSHSRSEHWMHGLALNASTGAIDWEAVASVYDQKKDISRSATPSSGLDSGLGDVRPGGQVTYADGTGWQNLDLRGQWRLGGTAAGHTLSFGLHHDRYQLASVTYGTAASPVADWLSSDTGTLNTNSFGKTRTEAVYLQDEWRVAPGWMLIVGGRQEHWKAYDGSNFNAANALPNPKNLVYADRSYSHFSPKLHLAWQATPTLSLKASVGKGVRYPTVAEMFQTFAGANNLRFNDPNLLPEQVLSTELVAQKQWDSTMLRGSYFYEDKRDALISQTDITVTPNITSIQNVDRMRTQGMELAFQAADVGWRGLDLNGSLTYTHSLITANHRSPRLVGTAQPRIPDWRATLVATWHASETLSTSLSYRFSGRQHNGLANAITGQFADVNPNVYGAVSHYSVFDAKVAYRFSPQWSAALGINNLGNFKYYVNPNPYPQRTWFGSLKYDL